MREAVNLAITLPGVPLSRQLALARRAGFAGFELYWPWQTAAPSEEEIGDLLRDVREDGLPLVQLGLYAGDMAAGDRGIASWPGRTEELLHSATVAKQLADELGVRRFTVLYGNRLESSTPEDQDAVALDALAEVARLLAEAGATVLLEPVSRMAAYPLRSAADVIAVIEQLESAHDATNVALLADLYHLTINGDDIDRVLATHLNRIGHVQLADAPGRGAPGTGELPLADWLRRLSEGGYDGWVSYEYTPDPADPFGWRRPHAM